MSRLASTVTVELVRDEHRGDVREPLEQLPEELLRGVLVPPTLHENIQDIPALIHGPPQIVALLVDRDSVG
jgi:hypothetical protein